MNDDNNLNIQRRNLLIINSVIFLLAVTNTTITKFTIIGIEFKMDNSTIQDFNTIFLIVWIYFNLRYLSTLVHDTLNQKYDLYQFIVNGNIIKKFSYNYKNVTTKRITKTLLQIINYYVLNKYIYEIVIPVLFTSLNVYLYFEISFILIILVDLLLLSNVIVLATKVNKIEEEKKRGIRTQEFFNKAMDRGRK